MTIKLLFFKSLVDQDLTIIVELKNGVEIEGTLDFVDENLNFNLTNIEIKNKARYPMFLNMKNIFVRGSSIRYQKIRIIQMTIQKKIHQVIADFFL